MHNSVSVLSDIPSGVPHGGNFSLLPLLCSLIQISSVRRWYKNISENVPYPKPSHSTMRTEYILILSTAARHLSECHIITLPKRFTPILHNYFLYGTPLNGFSILNILHSIYPRISSLNLYHHINIIVGKAVKG